MAKLIDRRYRWPKEKRKFGKDTYVALMSFPTKQDANSEADRWRKKGWNVRIVPFQKTYVIYYTRR